MKLNFALMTSSIILTLLVGCSGQNFRKKIENDEHDSLRDESFMRFNSKRIELYEKKSPNDISKAQAACHEEKYFKGLDSLENKMQQEKTNPFYWNAIGTCYYLQDQISKATFFYELATEALKNYKGSDKNFAEASLENNLGLINLKFSKFNEAFDNFKKSGTLAPNFLTPKLNMAQIYLEFNQNDRALEILKSIESKARNDIDLLYAMSLAYYRMNDFEKSYNSISKMDRNYLNRSDIVGLYALNLMKKNRLVEAKEILEKRIVATEFEERNRSILENVNEHIKEQDKKKTN